MAETSVKYLHSELPGAPVLNGTAGSLIAVLDAGLVTGWGLLTASSVTVSGGVATAAFATSHAFEPDTIAQVAGATPASLNGQQRVTSTTTNSVSWAAPGVADGVATGTITIKLAPAGWAKVTGANKTAYKSGNPSASGCWARIDDTAGRFARLRAYESMTDIDTGIGPTPTEVQQTGGLYISKSDAASSSPRRWIIIASDKFVVLLVAHYGSYINDYAPFCWGDFPSLKAGDAYNFLVSAETSDRSGNSGVGTGSPMGSWVGSTGVFIVRSYAQIGGSISGYTLKPGLQDVWSGSSANPLGPNPVNNSLDVIPTVLIEGTTSTGNRRGAVPAIYAIPHNVGALYDSKQSISAIVGLPGHVLIGVRFGGGNGNYRFAVDITGPWE
jgi:hypothetical protein